MSKSVQGCDRSNRASYRLLSLSGCGIHRHNTPLRPGSDNTHHTGLIRPAFRFTKIKVTVSNGRKCFARFRWCRETGKQIKRMITFHHRIARYSIHTNCIMTGELRIIFRIIQSAIQEKPDTCIRPQYVSFSISSIEMPLACMWFPSLPFNEIIKLLRGCIPLRCTSHDTLGA